MASAVVVPPPKLNARPVIRPEVLMEKSDEVAKVGVVVERARSVPLVPTGARMFNVPVVVAPPLMVSPPVWSPLPIVLDAVIMILEVVAETPVEGWVNGSNVPKVALVR